MAAPQLLTTTDERQMLDRIKRAVDLVDGKGLSPDDAITKVASDDKLGPGAIETVCRAYNTGRQLGQWRANTGIMDKLASFPLADAAKVVSKLYPPAEAHKPHPSMDKAASADYALPPSWLPDTRAMEASRRVLPMEKSASAGGQPAAPAGTPEWRMRKAYGEFERAKFAAEESRRKESQLSDRLSGEVASLVGYFKQASHARLPFAQAEHAAKAYLGDAAVMLLKMAHERAKLKEAGADKVPIQKTAFDMRAEPFRTVERCVKLAEDLVAARREAEAAGIRLKEVRAEGLRPFSQGDVPAKTAGDVGLKLFQALPEKKAIALGPAVGSAVGTMIGSYPKAKSDMVEDEWLDLESPDHQNELRKIKAHAMLTSMMTDPDDPVSGADPDKVLSNYNELAQVAPRSADSAAIIRPLLRKRLAGNTEPFEAKELVDIEKGVLQSRNPTPSGSILSKAPDALLG